MLLVGIYIGTFTTQPPTEQTISVDDRLYILSLHVINVTLHYNSR